MPRAIISLRSAPPVRTVSRPGRTATILPTPPEHKFGGSAGQLPKDNGANLRYLFLWTELRERAGKDRSVNASAKQDSPTSRSVSPRMFRASTTKNRNTAEVFKLYLAPHLKREEREEREEQVVGMWNQLFRREGSSTSRSASPRMFSASTSTNRNTLAVPTSHQTPRQRRSCPSAIITPQLGSNCTPSPR